MKSALTARAVWGWVVFAMIFGNMTFIHADRLHAAPSPAAEIQPEAQGLVNVNRASFEELQTVRGIGPSIARRIIQYREESGPFESTEDLANIRGVGGAKLQKVKNQISV